jgi:hypothetical protein
LFTIQGHFDRSTADWAGEAFDIFLRPVEPGHDFVRPTL